VKYLFAQLEKSQSIVEIVLLDVLHLVGRDLKERILEVMLDLKHKLLLRQL
jgi:hypothetical protein